MENVEKQWFEVAEVIQEAGFRAPDPTQLNRLRVGSGAL